MSNTVRFKRSDLPGKRPSLNDLTPGELAINTFDGKLFTNQTSGAISKIIEIGATDVDNVLYVSKSGDDSNSGKTLGSSFLTLKAAAAVASPGTTIYLKSGEYIEDNPVRIPAKVAVVGDSLRTTTIRPKNPTEDICWVNNGSYITQLNFKGHLAPAAAVAFPTDGSAGWIVTSPYVQSCTSITTTGTGMRVDGAHSDGLKSMVVDAFTQYNQGGVGIHMLNGGNTQLVSVFTICCDISFLCENGGFCSITNSNSSFGNRGLVSRGASEALYTGTVKGDTTGTEILFKNLSQRPNIGDGVLFAAYSQNTCERDVGLIVDSLALDLLYSGNTQSTFAGLRYWDRDVTKIPNETTQTLAAIEYANSIAQDIVQNITVTPTTGNTQSQIKDLVNPGSVNGTRIINNEFSLISNILENGPKASQIIVEADLTLGEPEYQLLRQQILDQKATIQADTINYIDTAYPSLDYDRAKCSRDVEMLIDSVTQDLVFGSNYKTIIAGLAYLRSDAGYVYGSQSAETIEAIGYVQSRIANIVSENPYAVNLVNDRFSTIIDIIQNGDGVVPLATYPYVVGLDTGTINAIEIIQLNKEFIVTEVIEALAKEFNSLVYDPAICIRDIKYVLDAICYDLAYGGNSQTINAANQYYSYSNGNLNVNPLEKAATLYAYAYTQLTTEKVVINDVIQSLQDPQTVFQDISHAPATVAQTSTIDYLTSILLNIVETGTTGSSDTILSNGLASTDNDIINNYNLLQSNKEFIQAEVVAWINDQIANATPGSMWENFVYDDSVCLRDVGYIVDSVSFDLLHGGNRQAVQAGVYYYGSSETTNLIEPQAIQTVGAFNFIKTLVNSIITATPVTEQWQNDVNQITDLPAATSAEVQAVQDNVDLIINIFTEGTGSVTREPIGLIASSDTNVQNAFNLLVANRDFIRKETIQYINRNWYFLSEGTAPYYTVASVGELTLGTTETEYPDVTTENVSLQSARAALLLAKEDIKTSTIAYLVANFFDDFVFDKAKCYRDVGLIVDAVTDDLVFDSNYKTITAGMSYLRAYTSKVITSQKVQTIAALKAARDFTIEKVIHSQAIEEITNKYNLVIDIIDQGESAVPELVFTNPLNTDSGITNSAAILQANKTFIQAEVIAYINEYLNPFNFTESVTCARDVGLIIDALAYDIATGSNYQSVVAGLSYLRSYASAVLIEPQKTATVDALRFVKQLVINTVSASSVAIASASANMDSIINIIQYGASATPALSYPTPTGANQDLVDANTQLRQNKAFIQAEIIAYLNQNFVGFEYDPTTQAKCERDIEYITTAAAYDMALGTNYNSVTAGLAYTRANSAYVSSNQKPQTISGIQKSLDLALGYITDNTAATRYTNAVNEVVDILFNGGSSADALNFPSPTGVNLNLVYAKDKLIENKNFIRAEIIAYVNDNLDPDTYNQEKCSRDVGYIVDALCYDVLYGGNSATIRAAEAYYVGTASQLGTNEADATAFAYAHLGVIVSSVVQGQTINPSPSNTETQVTAGNVATLTQGTILNNLVGHIRDVIVAGNLSTLPTTVYPNTSWADSNINTDKSAVLAAVNTIKNGVSTFISSEFNGFVYNPSACSRDVGYIIDALSYDILYTSNWGTVLNASAYFFGSTLQLGTDQATTTLIAYDHLAYIIGKIIQGQSITKSASNLLTQVTSGGTATATQATALSQLIQIIQTVISENGVSSLPAISYPNVSWASAERQVAKNALLTARSTIQSSTISHIQNSERLVYNEEKCSRDVGLIVDALSYDLLYGSNFRSIRAGQAYLRSYAAVVMEDAQKYATLSALDFVKAEVISALTGNSAAVSSATNNINTIINIINIGVTATPEMVVIEPPGFAQGFADAKALILANEEFILAELNQYIETNYPEIEGRDVCLRDISYIIDSLEYDMTYGGNSQSVEAGRAYYNGTTITLQFGEKAQTVETYAYLRDIIVDIAQNIPVSALQTNVAQVSGTAGSVEAATVAGELVETIRIIINDINRAPGLLVEPTYEWVDSSLITSRNALQAARSSIQDNTINNINATKYFIYNEEACARDVGLIVDALTYDLLYGGNIESINAGIAYYSGTNINVVAGELNETISAYTHLQTIVQPIVRNALITPTIGNTETQNVSLPAGNATASITLKNLVTYLITVVKGGANESPRLMDHNFANGNPTYANIRSSLQAEKTTIQAQTLNYIETRLITFNKEICSRDVGLIIDAVSYDIVFDSNYQTVVAGMSYYQVAAALVKNFQLGPTLAAIEFIKTESVAVVSGNATAVSRLNSKFTTLYNIVENGSSAVPGITYPVPTGVDTNVANAVLSIQANKDFIVAETVAYLASDYSYLNYNIETCSRDVGYVLNAITYDLLYGGNSQTKYSAEQYYTGGQLAFNVDEKTATTAAYSYIDLLVRQIIVNTVVNSYQINIPQDLSNDAASQAEVNTIAWLFDAATDIISSGYTCLVTLGANFNETIANNTITSFHQTSLISASGHTFEWIGSGTDINSALPYNGGIPIEANEIISEDGGKIYFTSTDQKGNFKIGAELTIQRDSGSIIGRAFNKSLLGVITPYILALEG